MQKEDIKRFRGIVIMSGCERNNFVNSVKSGES